MMAPASMPGPAVAEAPAAIIAPEMAPPTSAASAPRRLLRGASWAIAGSIVGQGCSFLGSVVAARVLGKESYGQLALVQGTVGALSSLACLGLGVTATKYVSEYRTTDPQRAGRILGLSSMVALLAAVCFCAALIVFAPSLAITSGNSHLEPAAVRIGGIYLFFVTLNGYQVGALVGLEAFRRIAAITAACGLATLPVVWLLSLWLGLRGAVLAQGMTAFLLCALCHAALTQEGRVRNVAVRYRGAWQQRSALARFSIPATASGIVVACAMWWCSVLLVKSHGYAELALFYAANNMRLMIVLIPSLAARVASPLLNHMSAQGDRAGYKRTFWMAVAANALIALLIAGVLVLEGRHVFRLFGKEFVGPAALILLMSAAAVGEVISSSLYQVVFTGNSLWMQLAISAVWTIVLVFASNLTIVRHGTCGLAFSYLMAWCSSAILYAWVLRRRGFAPALDRARAIGQRMEAA
jgi:O-antigen/teichoic acid export membrane protein